MGHTRSPRVLAAGHVLPALGAVGALLLAACGAAGPSGPSPGTSDPPKIVLGTLSSAASHSPIYVALQKGFFTRAGLDVSTQQLSGGTPAAMAALATGSVNMMYAGANEFIQYAAKKVIAGKVVAEVSDSTFDFVVAKGIAGIPQLKGRIVAISGPNGADQIYVEALLRHYGLSMQDVTFVSTGSPANRLTALASGAVHAIAVANASRDISGQVGTVLVKSSDSPVQLPGGLLFANQDLITSRRAELKKFIAALAEATAWIRANPAAAAVECARGSGLTLEACSSGITALTDASINTRFTWSTTLEINTEGVAEALELEAARSPEAAGLTLASIVDTSLTAGAP